MWTGGLSSVDRSDGCAVYPGSSCYIHVEYACSMNNAERYM